MRMKTNSSCGQAVFLSTQRFVWYSENIAIADCYFLYLKAEMVSKYKLSPAHFSPGESNPCHALLHDGDAQAHYNWPSSNKCSCYLSRNDTLRQIGQTGVICLIWLASILLPLNRLLIPIIFHNVLFLILEKYLAGPFDSPATPLSRIWHQICITSFINRVQHENTVRNSNIEMPTEIILQTVFKSMHPDPCTFASTQHHHQQQQYWRYIGYS